MDQKEASEVAAKLQAAQSAAHQVLQGFALLFKQSKGRSNCGNISIQEMLTLHKSILEICHCLDQTHAALSNEILNQALSAQYLANVLTYMLIDKGIIKDEAELNQYSVKFAAKMRDDAAKRKEAADAAAPPVEIKEEPVEPVEVAPLFSVVDSKPEPQVCDAEPISISATPQT
jgi:hypothetical protein